MTTPNNVPVGQKKYSRGQKKYVENKKKSRTTSLFVLGKIAHIPAFFKNVIPRPAESLMISGAL